MRFGFVLVLLSATALADPLPPVRIRMAAYAPEGTSWAKEFHTIDREVQEATNGRVQMHWVLGGIAGDEFTALDRVRKGQLDGEAGALFCEKLAPTMRVGRIVGLFQDREEWRFVMSRLLRDIDAEFARNGFVNLGVGSFGNVMMFTRRPVRSMADLKKERLWTYDLDEIVRSMLQQMGASLVPTPLDQAFKAYEDDRSDGFLATPTSMLAFQWSTRARFYSDLPVSELPGCFVIAQRTMDALTLPQREVIRTAVAKFVGRFNELGRMQDAQLLGGVFEKQGMHKVPAPDALRSDFLEAARAARDKMAGQLVPPELLQRTLSLLADYRSERVRGR